jgi:hypothetical protein
MAQLCPSTLPPLRQNGGLYRELDVLEKLRLSLSDGYEIFHSVGLHSVHENIDRFGEIDIVILGPSGNILLMEIKAGSLVLRDGDIFKIYHTKEHDVGRQCTMQYAVMINRLKNANLDAFLSTCLVLPDFSLDNVHVVSIPKERIIDANQFEHVGALVKTMLGVGSGCSDLPRLKLFLRNEFQVSLDLSNRVDQVKNTVRLLADGLATWVPRITSPSGIARIQATAGSGKTQLALKLLENAVTKKQTAAYVCYNRSLADHLRSLAPVRVEVANFHELCISHFRKSHEDIVFDDGTVFQNATKQYVEDSADFTERLDLLIIDEGQDFEADWVESLCASLKYDGILYFMEDQDQRLYDRPPIELENAVTINSNDNFRSPGRICQFINALGLTSGLVKSLNPYDGDYPEFFVYKSESDLIRKTSAAIEHLISLGYAPEEIVVLTGSGRSKSVLMALSKIGNYQVKKFTGTYDDNADPIWTEGQILVDTIYRFKGQSAPAIILSEMDFSNLDDIERRKLFVGLTRGQMTVDLVISERSEAVLRDMFAGPN